MKKSYCLSVFFQIILFFGILSNLLGQSNNENLIIEGFKFPQPTVKNLVKWVNFTTKEWETEMKNYQFQERGFDKNCIYYGSGSSLSGVFSIKRCPEGTITVWWFNPKRNGKTILDNLFDELEPYFEERTTDDVSRYSLKIGDNVYSFAVSRTSSSINQTNEIVIITKSN